MPYKYSKEANKLGWPESKIWKKKLNYVNCIQIIVIVGVNYQISKIFLDDKGIYFNVCFFFLSFLANSKITSTNETPCTYRVSHLSVSLLRWPKMIEKRNIHSYKSLYHEEKCWEFDNSYQKLPLSRYNWQNSNFLSNFVFRLTWFCSFPTILI